MLLHRKSVVYMGLVAASPTLDLIKSLMRIFDRWEGVFACRALVPENLLAVLLMDGVDHSICNFVKACRALLFAKL